jgi:hypothetical protein
MNHYLTVMFLLCLNFFFRWNLEMTGHQWVLNEEGVGGGFTATNPLLRKRKYLSFRT